MAFEPPLDPPDEYVDDEVERDEPEEEPWPEIDKYYTPEYLTRDPKE